MAADKHARNNHDTLQLRSLRRGTLAHRRLAEGRSPVQYA